MLCLFKKVKKLLSGDFLDKVSKDDKELAVRLYSLYLKELEIKKKYRAKWLAVLIVSIFAFIALCVLRLDSIVRIIKICVVKV